MIWKLSMKVREWSPNLIFPLTLPHPETLHLFQDPALMAPDMLDEVLYTIQAVRRHRFELLTRMPGVLLEYMRSSETRWELVQRLPNVFWGAALTTYPEALRSVPQMLAWPVANRWALACPQLNLYEWTPHSFSTIGHSGVCEDCGHGRSESGMHRVGAIQAFQRIDYAQHQASFEAR